MAYSKTIWVTGSTPLSASNMNHIEQGIKDAHDLIANIMDLVYPVGSYFEISDAEFDPNVSFIGTWILETEGQVHVSAGTNYPVSGADSNTSDGGNKDAIVPYHRHSIPKLSGTAASAGGHTHAYTEFVGGQSYWVLNGAVYGFANEARNTSSAGAHTHSVSTNASNTGYEGTSGNATNANMQPHINVYRWHRTA